MTKEDGISPTDTWDIPVDIQIRRWLIMECYGQMTIEVSHDIHVDDGQSSQIEWYDMMVSYLLGWYP